MARLRVRLSLKVLKSKNTHGDWIYAPQPHGDMTALHAVSKIVGSACVAQCVTREFESEGFVLTAVLPRADADATKIGGFGCFLAVDRRPMSSNRGTLRKIVECFHDALKTVGCVQLHAVKTPFLQLDISCPRAAYDINVEPSKDDVLFADPKTILTIAARFFQSVYGTSDAIPVVAESHATTLANHLGTERRSEGAGK
jgi:DNA mismatch repair ATPase MutL